MERGESPVDGPAVTEMSTSMEKERILNDDPKWNGEPCVSDILGPFVYWGDQRHPTNSKPLFLLCPF